MDPQQITQIGPYPVRRFIAEGGMAWVFEVTDPDAFDAPRALKMLKPGMGEDIFRRFKEEAGILTRIDHPNLITIYKFGFDETSGCHYYTMTLLTGGHLGLRGVIPLEEAAEIFLGVLGGLARLHDHNIIHRDIKPSNIMIGGDGWPKLADLGIARTADVAEGDTWYASTKAGATSTGIAIGTPAYMSPEQARGQRGIGKPTDVFSFGLTMYTTLTGHTIYDEIDSVDSTSGMDILQYLGHLRIARGEFEFRFDSQYPIPPSVQDVIRTSCAIDPAARYPDAAAMLRALKQAIADPDASTGEHLLRDESESGSKRGLVLAAGALLVLGLAVGGGYWLWKNPEGKPAPEPEVAADLTRESVSELERVVTRVIDAASAARPKVAPELLTSARKKHGAALTLLELSANKPAFLTDSQAQFLEACQVLVAGDLEARFTRGADEARRVAVSLGEMQVKELAAADWTRLEGQITALAPPEADASSCARAVQYETEIAEVEVALRTGREIEQKLKEKWPELAAAARNEAVHEQSALAQLELEAPEFVDALQRGTAALAAGDAAIQSQSFLAARDHFWAAKDAFAEAEVVADAAQAGVKTREAIARAAKLDIRDAAIEAQASRADELMKDKRFAEAKTTYEQATRFLDVSVGEATQSVGARKAREVADRAHADAKQAGAERSALTEIGTADAAYATATEAFEKKSFEEAERAYGEAAKAYGVARTKAVAEVDRARKEGQLARATAKEFAKPESCAPLSEAARTACEAAHQSLADADGAVAAGDTAAAIALYSQVSEGFQEAREILRAEKENQPKPPTIASRKPVAEAVTAAKGKSVPFEISARDLNAKDVLRYAWTIDNVAQSETGPRLDFVPEGTQRVEVKVDDGTGLEARAGWMVTVTNQPPTLSLAPAVELTKIEPGGKVAFTAQASDPDGEAVEVAYFVDGKPAGSGPAFEFRGAKDGRYVIEARATDPSGGEKRARRSVEVSGNKPPTVALKPAQSLLKLEEGKTLQFEASAKDPEDDPVQLAFFVDGRKASDGPSFTFQGAPGKHTVEARATDPDGLAGSSKRIVEVASVKPIEPPPVVEAPVEKPVEKPAEKPIETPEIAEPAPAGGNEAYVKQIRETMSLYKQYFQARNLSSLNSVWSMNMMEKMELQGLFGKCAAGKLEVALKYGKPALKGATGKQATLEFSEVVKCNGGVIRSEQRVANFVLYGTDEWQIKTLQSQ